MRCTLTDHIISRIIGSDSTPTCVDSVMNLLHNPITTSCLIIVIRRNCLQCRSTFANSSVSSSFSRLYHSCVHDTTMKHRMQVKMKEFVIINVTILHLCFYYLVCFIFLCYHTGVKIIIWTILDQI